MNKILIISDLDLRHNVKDSFNLTDSELSETFIFTDFKRFDINSIEFNLTSKNITGLSSILIINDLHKGIKETEIANVKIITSDNDNITKALIYLYKLTGRKIIKNYTPYRICESLADVYDLINYVKETKECCFDIETTGLDFINDKILTISFSWQHGAAYILPIWHDEISPELNSYLKTALDLLEENIFDNPEIIKCGWNIKFDLKFIKKAGIKTSGIYHDGMLMYQLINENVSHSLYNALLVYYPEIAEYKNSVKNLVWAEIPLKRLSAYNASDTDYTLRLCHYFLGYLKFRLPKCYNIYMYNITAAINAFTEIEMNGMLVDSDKLKESIEIYKGIIKDLENELLAFQEVKNINNKKAEIEKKSKIDSLREKLKKAKTPKSRANIQMEINNLLADGIEIKPFNLNSVPAMKTLLYTKEGFNFKISGDEEDISTDKNNLLKLQKQDKKGFISKLLSYRAYQKILGTYLESLTEKLDSNNRVHSEFLLHGTTTGRISCKNPNLQNLPRGAEGKVVKELFVAPANHSIVQVDFSQLELRLIANISNDKAMIEAYKNFGDLHIKTAQSILKIDSEGWEKLDKAKKKEARTQAKACNFGLCYGMGANGFKEYAANNYNVVLSQEEAENMRNDYFNTYSSLKAWHSKYESLMKKNKFVETMFGRRRNLNPENKDKYQLSEMTRQAINTPIQGTGGEYALFCISILHRVLPNYVQIVNTVHDSIIFYIPDGKLHIIKLIKFVCENAPVETYFNTSFDKVKLKVDVEIGKVWGNLEEMKL